MMDEDQLHHHAAHWKLLFSPAAKPLIQRITGEAQIRSAPYPRPRRPCAPLMPRAAVRVNQIRDFFRPHIEAQGEPGGQTVS